MDIEKEALEFKRITGIELPAELIELYKQKGNGGFGPDYGLIGVINGHKTDLDDSILSLYQSFTSNEDEDDPLWHWPEALIPFIHVGCGIHLCIDTQTNQVVEFDPTDYDVDIGSAPHFKELGQTFSEWANEHA
jgi:hypothetical protein